MSHYLNYPKDDEDEKWWGSRSKVNRCLAVIAFSYDRENAIQNLRRIFRYPHMFRHYHAWNNLGCWVNYKGINGSMKGMPFHNIDEPWYDVIPFREDINAVCWGKPTGPQPMTIKKDILDGYVDSDLIFEWNGGIGPFDIRVARKGTPDVDVDNVSGITARTYSYNVKDDGEIAGTYYFEVKDTGDGNKILKSREANIQAHLNPIAIVSTDPRVSAYANGQQTITMDYQDTPLEVEVHRLDYYTGQPIAGTGNASKFTGGDVNILKFDPATVGGDTKTKITVVAEGNTTYTLTSGDGFATSTINVIVVGAVPPSTAPTITTDPVGGTYTAGGIITMSVVATGTGTLSYQWYKDGSVINGATSASYNVASSATTDSGTYYVNVYNTEAGKPISAATKSADAVVVVNQAKSAAPTITKQPDDATIFVNGTFTVKVEASPANGGTLSYQWYETTNTGAPVLLNGKTDAEFDSTPQATARVRKFKCYVYNTEAGKLISDATISDEAVITIQAAPTATSVTVTPAVTQSIGTGQTIQFHAVVNGTNNPPQTVSWAATAGTFNQTTGVWTAPDTPTNTPISIIATSTFNTSAIGSAQVSKVVDSNPIVWASNTTDEWPAEATDKFGTDWTAKWTGGVKPYHFKVVLTTDATKVYNEQDVDEDTPSVRFVTYNDITDPANPGPGIYKAIITDSTGHRTFESPTIELKVGEPTSITLPSAWDMITAAESEQADGSKVMTTAINPAVEILVEPAGATDYKGVWSISGNDPGTVIDPNTGIVTVSNTKDVNFDLTYTWTKKDGTGGGSDTSGIKLWNPSITTESVPGGRTLKKGATFTMTLKDLTPDFKYDFNHGNDLNKVQPGFSLVWSSDSTDVTINPSTGVATVSATAADHGGSLKATMKYAGITLSDSSGYDHITA